MASSRRTYDTDSITLRTVFAKNPDNTNVPALRTLTADGLGGSYWAIPSSLGGYPAFNRIITDAATYNADLSYNTFRITGTSGIGIANGPAGSNQMILYGQAFQTIDVSGDNSIQSSAASSNIFRVAGQGGITVSAEPMTRTLFIGAPTSAISTGVYAFFQNYVVESVSSIQTSAFSNTAGVYITANSTSTVQNWAGVGDILLSANTLNKGIFISISSFNSAEYLAMSTAAFTFQSTIAGDFLTKEQFSTGLESYSSLVGLKFSTVIASAALYSTIIDNDLNDLEAAINNAIAIGAAATASNLNVIQQGLSSLVSYPSFVSSIPIFTVTSNQVDAVVYPGFGNVLVTSSIGFNLSSFSSFINPDSRIQIQMKGSLFFSAMSNTDDNNPVQFADIANILVLNDFAYQISETGFFDQMPISAFISTPSGTLLSNYYKMDMLCQIDTSNVINFYDSNYLLLHAIPYVGSPFPGVSGFYNSNFSYIFGSSNIISPNTNSLFLYVNN